jgi:addiction module RelB/DinJ family antitoxin
MNDGKLPKRASIINVRVGADAKRDFEALLEQMGMNISVAVNILVRQMLIEGGLPFKPSIHPNGGRRDSELIAIEERLRDLEIEFREAE